MYESHLEKSFAKLRGEAAYSFATSEKGQTITCLDHLSWLHQHALNLRF